jgi:hypothetical protein
MKLYDAPEVVTMGPATALVRQSGEMSSEGGCGCGKFLFIDGDPLNTDTDDEEDDQ